MSDFFEYFKDNLSNFDASIIDFIKLDDDYYMYISYMSHLISVRDDYEEIFFDSHFNEEDIKYKIVKILKTFIEKYNLKINCIMSACLADDDESLEEDILKFVSEELYGFMYSGNYDYPITHGFYIKMNKALCAELKLKLPSGYQI